MTITVSSGVTSSGLTISPGNPLVVLNGGTINNIFVDSGGSVTISAGGLSESHVEISSGATLSGAGDVEQVEDYGSVAGVTLVGGGFIEVGIGSTTDVTVTQSSDLIVESVGHATGTLVVNGGRLDVIGADSDASIGSGSEELIRGGVASGDVIHSGGLLFAEGKLSDETVQSGAMLVFANGISGDVSAGIQTNTMSLKGVTVSSGALLEVDDATVLSGATLSLAGTSAYDNYAGFGFVDVDSGGTLLGPGFIRGGVIAGSVSGVTLEPNPDKSESLKLVSGASVSDLTVEPDPANPTYRAALEIDAGATTTGTMVTYSYEIVTSGGSATGTTLDDQAVEEVLAGAAVTGTTVVDAYQDVASGGVAYDTTLQVRGFGEQRVYSGGVASGDVIGNFDAAVVYEGGRLVDATVGSGAIILARGATTGTTVSGGGVEEVGPKAVAGDTLVVAGGYEMVRGGVASGTVVAGGKAAVFSGGLAVGAVVSEGGELELLSAGTASAAGVSDGGKLVVKAGGLASGTTVSGGGLEYVLSGAVASAGAVSGGGKVVVSSGGTAIGIDLLAGGVLVDDGEVRIAGSESLAGTLEGSGAIVETGGGVLTLDAPSGVFAGRAVISGGTVELAAKEALGGGSVQFVAPKTGSAVLQIEAADLPKAGGSFANAISNFASAGEAIDLASLAYVPGATATLTGSSLVVADGGSVYDFNLKGAVAAGYSVTSDGHGGTLIDAGTTLFAQAAAAFAPSNAVKTATVPGASPTALTPVVHAAVSSGMTYF